MLQLSTVTMRLLLYLTFLLLSTDTVYADDSELPDITLVTDEDTPIAFKFPKPDEVREEDGLSKLEEACIRHFADDRKIHKDVKHNIRSEEINRLYRLYQIKSSDNPCE